MIDKRTLRGRFFSASFVLSVVLVFAVPAKCEVRSLTLPAVYADFALHPETGTVAAVLAESNEVAFFRQKDLSEGKSEPFAKQRVGSTPCSIVYKQFGQQRIFAVVCVQDSHMYLFHAGAIKHAESDFSLLKKVELSQSGVAFVTASINPLDPFLYYCHGAGHDSTTGCVSLRDLRAKGVAFGDSMDCAVTASGDVAYRRGPWSPSGFESLIRTNELSETKPEFSRLFYDHTSSAPYVPDPFDRYTAVGSKVFTRDLQKNVAGLDFMPQCFFKTRPLVVGLTGVDPYSRGRKRSNNDQNQSLRVASYNTFTTIGEQVKIEPVVSEEKPPGSELKQVKKRFRVFADDARERVIYANGNRLHIVPLTQFNLPDEPFLLANLSASKVFALQENRLALKPMDKRIEIAIDETPDGMKADGLNFVWTPDSEQVGPATIVATMKHQDIQRTLRFDLDVTFPSTQLPFAPVGFAVDADAKNAVIWDGVMMDQFGRHQGAAPTIVQMALIDLATGNVLAQRRVADQIGACILTEQHVIVRPALHGSPKCEVLRAKDLQREKTLIAGGPLVNVTVAEKKLIVQTDSTTEVYDTATFKRLKSFATAGHRNESLLDDGLFVQGVIIGFDLKPRLVVNLDRMASIGNIQHRSREFLDHRDYEDRMLAGFHPRNGQSRVGTVSVPGSKIQIALDSRKQQLSVPGATHTWRTEFELSLTASGAVDARQVIVRKQLHSQTGSQVETPPPLLQAGKNDAFVVYGKELFRWQIPKPTNTEASTSAELKFVPRQSVIGLEKGKTTTLQHSVQGSKPPVNFAISASSKAIKIDEKSGDVTIDNDAIRREAAEVLQAQVKEFNRGEPYVQTLRQVMTTTAESATHALGRRPQGVPVAIPIQVSASDADLASDRLSYFVIAEIAEQTMLHNLQELDEQREKQRAEMAAKREQMKQQAAEAGMQPPGSAGTVAELKEVKQKLEALEQRIDLLTRQLNLVLKKLDEAD